MQKTVEQLGKLFGSTAQVKCMRLFLQQPDRAFAVTEIAERTRSSIGELRKALVTLRQVGFVVPRKVTVKKKLKSGKIQTKKLPGFELKKTYPLIPHLHTLLVSTELIQNDEIQSMFAPVGKMHLLVLSGHFAQDEDRMIDLMLVSDRVNERMLNRAVKTLESEIGREIRYAHFTLPEYQYRMTMYDKLLRDIFDYPHIVIIDKVKK